MSGKPDPCSKVKNACKYCRQEVTNKNGLQCHGACGKWAHFKCLNYTPGKISDIKAGITTVLCPCPDCETPQEKEFLTNPPYLCPNPICPANVKGIKCDSAECFSSESDNAIQSSNNACPTQIKKPLSATPSPRPKSPVCAPKKPAKLTFSDSCCSCKNANLQGVMVSALQEMCATVGKLGIQIKELICKLDKLK